MYEILLDLAKIGFHGAAIGMAVLTYKLLRKALQMWGPEVQNNAQETLRNLLREIRYFMGLTAVLFFVGVGAQLFGPQSSNPKAHIIVSPSSWPKNVVKMEGLLKVKHQQNKLTLDDGEVIVSIEDKDRIRFILSELVYEFDLLDRDYRYLLSKSFNGGGFEK